MSTPRVMVGVSGGVDSSVAAWRLVQQGEAVAGLFMQNWADDGSGDCRAEDDRRDAVAVANRLLEDSQDAKMGGWVGSEHRGRIHPYRTNDSALAARAGVPDRLRSDRTASRPVRFRWSPTAPQRATAR